MSEPFDPDEFLAETGPTQEPFDPSAFLAETAPSPLDVALSEQSGPVVTVQTPTGPAQFSRSGEPIQDTKLKEATEAASSREKNLGRLVSFTSGSPAFGPVAGLAGLMRGQGYTKGRLDTQRQAERATQQFSPKIGPVPVLPLLGGMVATAPAGAARIGGTLGGVALNTARASQLARVGLQGGIGAAQAAGSGRSSLLEGDVAGTLKDVGIGLGAGLAGGALGEGVGSALGTLAARAAPAAERLANTAAVKALLGGGTMVNRLKNQLGVGSEAELQALGREVRGLGVLGGGPGGLFPRSVQGVSGGIQGRLAGEGAEIGRIRDLADSLVTSGKADPADAQKIAEAYVQGVKGAVSIADESAVAKDVLGRAQRIVEQASPSPGEIPTTQGGTFRGLWDQTSSMQRGAFSPLEPAVSQAAKKTLERAGVQSARGELGRQMGEVIGPDEAAILRDSMRRFSTAKRVSDVAEDSAARATARNAIGLTDQNFGTMAGQSIPGAALPVSALSSLLRGRVNSATALYAPTAARLGGPALGLTGAAATLGIPSAARQSATQLQQEDLAAIDAFLKAP